MVMQTQLFVAMNKLMEVLLKSKQLTAEVW
jgi:hypothetical protein